MMRIPRAGERVRVMHRLEDGKQSNGKILKVDRHEEEIILQYSAHTVVHERGTVRRGTIAYPDIAIVLAPDWFHFGGDIDSFYFEDLTWNSSEGGEGIWIVG